MSRPKRITDLTDEERAAIVSTAFRPAGALARWQKARDEEAEETDRVQEAYDQALRERQERRSQQP